MQVKCFVAIVASFFLSVTGCHLGGVGAREFGPGGGNSFGAGCTCGLCSGLVGRLSRAGCSACGDSGCAGGCASPNTLTLADFGAGDGYVGPLARFIGRNPRRAPLHMGAYPSPAVCPPIGTGTYPYYTTRGPRDFFVDDPPSIGR